MKWLAIVAAVLWAGVALAQPTVRGVGAAQSNTVSLLDMDVGPAQDSDLLVLICESDDPVSTPDGWTKVSCSPSQNTNTEASAFYRIAQCSGTGGAPDCDGTCEACLVTDNSNNHLLCAIMVVTKFTFNATTPIDACTTNQQATTTSVSITGTNATGTNSLVVAITAGAEQNTLSPRYSSWTNASLSSVTERISETTIQGNDGTLGVATGVRVSSGAWGTTTATGNSTTKANMSFNINNAPAANTATSTPTSTATITPTPTRTGTVTNTPTITNTPTVTNTRTATPTPTVTRTQTSTPTITQTPTRTPTQPICTDQASDGAHFVKSSCGMEEDDGSLVMVRPTPGGKAYYSYGGPRSFSEWLNAAGVKLGGSPSPYKIQNDATLTASESSRIVEFGRNPADIPTYTVGNLDGWGGVTKTIDSTVTAAVNFTGDLPERDGLAISPRRSYLGRCGPVTLDVSGVFCSFGTRIPTDTIGPGQSMRAEGCQVSASAVTLFADDDTLATVPASCVFFLSLVVNDTNVGQLCTVNGDASPPSNSEARCDNSATAALAFAAGDTVGLNLASLGAGCTGAVDVYAEWEVACGGGASD